MTIKTVQLLLKQSIKFRPLVSFFQGAKYVYVNYVRKIQLLFFEEIKRAEMQISTMQESIPRPFIKGLFGSTEGMGRPL